MAGDHDFLNIRRSMPPAHVALARSYLDKGGRHLTAWERAFLTDIIGAPGLNETAAHEVGRDRR
jgi:hypothetical protein